MSKVLLVLVALLTACNEGQRVCTNCPGTDGSTSTDASSDANPDRQVVTVDTVDPMCLDGMYSETLPNPSADISDLIRGYGSAGELESFTLAVLERRYPWGAAVVRGCRQDANVDRCITSWINGQPSSAEDVVGSLSTIVHEAGHLYDLSMGGFGFYEIQQGISLSCPDGDAISRGGRTLPRSAIYSDAFSAAIPPCQNQSGRDCDTYAYIYLDSRRGFGAEQGFASIIEEAVQYVNSIATGWAYADQLGRGVVISERDGILAFLWYIERYLHLTRTTEPDVYEFIASNQCWREAILNVWGRAWLFLEASERSQNLGIQDDDFEAQVRNPELLEEIDRIRMRNGC